MKKIMFNEKYGLTDAVLEGRKTMTRRVVKGLQNGVIDVRICEGVCECLFEGASRWLLSSVQPKYQVGEIVAIVQAYKDIADTHFFEEQCAANEESVAGMKYEKGWDNKMFVKSYYMPHHIRITNIKVERLQDISDEDCLKEGIIRRDDFINIKMEDIVVYTFENSFINHVYKTYPTPHEAFAALIDKVSGKGTWRFNPYVFVYSFEKID